MFWSISLKCGLTPFHRHNGAGRAETVFVDIALSSPTKVDLGLCYWSGNSPGKLPESEFYHIMPALKGNAFVGVGCGFFLVFFFFFFRLSFFFFFFSFLFYKGEARRVLCKKGRFLWPGKSAGPPAS